MNRHFALTVLCVLITAFSMAQYKNYGKPLVKPASILKDYTSFYIYCDEHAKLYEDFTALDTAYNSISKDSFLSLLTTGDYLPVKLRSKDENSYYKLHYLAEKGNFNIHDIIKEWGKLEYRYYQMQGKELPGFNFVDLEGNIYNKETTRGKILVLKCWFIGCVPCVAEIPELNELVDQFKNRDDILFVSLAFDSKNDLEKFFTKKPFHYSTVALQEEYVQESLHVYNYPTHLIVNKQGLVTAVVTNYQDMEIILKREALK